MREWPQSEVGVGSVVVVLNSIQTDFTYRYISSPNLVLSHSWTFLCLNSNSIIMAEWTNSIFGCFNNCGMCIITYFVPCYTAGKNAEAVGESCLLCGLIIVLPIANIIFPAQIRGKVREQKGIEGSFLGDIMWSFCCLPCSFIQVGQEIRGGECMAQSMARM